MLGLIQYLTKKRRINRVLLNILSSILVFAILYFISGKFAVKFLGEKKKLNFFDALYFSIVTQSTVGYGDLVPTNRLTKSIVMLQLLTIIAIIGVELG